MVEAHRKREVSRRVAERAIGAASNTTRGEGSGFVQALGRAGSYEAVRGAGNAYCYLSWPYPPDDPPKFHLVFDRLGTDRAREPVECADEAWPVIRDELAARGYGLHDAGYGSMVAVVLDREIESADQVDIFKQYGWIAHDDPTHQTSFV